MGRISKTGGAKGTRTLPARSHRRPNFFEEKWDVHHKPKVSKKLKAKLAKKTKKTKAGKLSASGAAKLRKSSSSSAAAKLLKKALGKGKKKAPKVPGERKKRDPNAKLTPRPGLKDFGDAHPLYESRLAVPFVSTKAQSRLLNRAACLGDVGLAKALLNDVKKLSSIDESRSLNDAVSPKLVALSRGHYAVFAAMAKEALKPRKRVEEEVSLIQPHSTGNYNFAMLGHAVRAIQSGRGGREGNGALCESAHYRTDPSDTYPLTHGAAFEDLQRAVNDKLINQWTLAQNIFRAVRVGDRKLAGKLVQAYATHGFNDLHVQVLLNEREPLKPFRAVSVKKKGQDNRDISPLHCAAIHPRDDYLRALMAVEPDFNHPDQNGWKAVHYAAVSPTADCLRLLLAKGASGFDIDKLHSTPLHHAAEVGRPDNLQLLYDEMKTSDEEGAFLNKKNRYSFAPIHLAARAGRLETVEKLVALGADLNLQTGAGKGKLTPLMLAAEAGHLHIVRWLHKTHNVQLDKRDKLKRTALAHAVKQGQAHVVSYLLRAGVNPDLPDSSGNAPVHYAAAMGWVLSLELLMEAGAELRAANDWQLTPLAVAYMKGHMGLVDLLLRQPNIDINCVDDRGMTLVSLTLTSAIQPSTHRQLEYLLKDKGADPRVPDSLGNTPLHILACAEVQLDWQEQNRLGRDEAKMDKEKKARVARIAALLLKFKADVSVVNQKDETPMTYALQTGKISLAHTLVKAGARLPPSETSLAGTNPLHRLANFVDAEEGAKEAAEIFVALAKAQPQMVKELLDQVDKDGFTPALRIAQASAKAPVTIPPRLLQAVVQTHPKALTQQDNLKAAIGAPESEESDEDEWSDDDEEETEADSGLLVDCQGESVFHMAVRGEAPGTLAALLREYSSLRAELRAAAPLEAREASRGHTALLAAAAAGKAEHALALLKAQADISVKSTKQRVKEAKSAQKNSEAEREAAKEAPHGLSVLHLAVAQKLRAVVECLVKEADPSEVADLIEGADSHGSTPLHYAAREASSDMADVTALLLGAAPQPTNRSRLAAQDRRGRTPLHIAANAATGTADVSTETVELLLKAGAATSARDARGRTPLHYVFVKIGKHTDTSFMDPIALLSVLMRHASDGDLAALDGWSNSLLHYAALRGANICLMSLLHSGRLPTAHFEAANAVGNRPLAISVGAGHKASSLTLLQANMDIHNSIAPAKLEARELVEAASLRTFRWAPVRKPAEEEKPVAIPDAVVRNEWQGVVYVILQQLGPDPRGLYSLVKAALQFRKYNLALTLIRGHRQTFQDKPSAEFKAGHEDEGNLFHVLAAFAGSGEGCEAMLLKVAEMLHGLAVAWHDARGSRPATLAAEAGNYTLLEFFAEQHPQKLKGLATLANQGRLEATNVLAHLLSEATRSRWASPAHLDWVRRLVKAGAQVDDPACVFRAPADPADQRGRPDLSLADKDTPLLRTTPLCRAIYAGHFDLVKGLLHSGADVNAPDAASLTPAMVAVRQNHLPILRLLLNPNYVDSDPLPDQDEAPEDFSNRRQFNTSNDEEEDEEEEDEDMEEDEEDEDDEEYDENGCWVPPAKRARKAEKAQAAVPAKLTKRVSSFKVKSKVDLSAKDKEGLTALDHCAMPIKSLSKANLYAEVGAWEHTELYDVLKRAKAPHGDLAVATAAAVRSGQAKLLRKLGVKRTAQMAGFDESHGPGAAKELGGVEVEPEKDAASFREADQRERAKAYAAKRKALQESLLKPHRLSGYRDTGEVLVCPNTSRRYNVLLNKTDVSYGHYGFYNFYRLQLIQRRGSQLFLVFTNWGRIGDEGQYQRTPFPNLADAVKEFRSIFRSKTGNDWDHIGNFEEKPKKYGLVERELDEWERAGTVGQLALSLRSAVPSRLPGALQSVFADLADVRALQANTRSVDRGRSLLAPFGMLRKDTLLKGRDLLVQLGKLILELEAGHGMTDKAQEERGLEIRRDIVRLNNAFYQTIPMAGMENSQLSVVDSSHALGTLWNAVGNLLEYEVAGEMVLGAAWRKAVLNPLDYLHAAVPRSFAHLGPDSPDLDHILHYVHATSPQTQVTGVWSVTGGNEGFPAGDANRMLMWHGTRSANLLSILRLGLLPAPPNALHNGYMFGRGLYTADTFAKAAHYSQGSGAHRYALLCEVALGSVEKRADLQIQMQRGTLPDGKHSIKAQGQQAPDPRRNLTLGTGAVVPLGQLVAVPQPPNVYWRLNYNEFIVFDPKRVAIRYLVQFKQ